MTTFFLRSVTEFFNSSHSPVIILQSYMQFWKNIYAGFCRNMLKLNEKAKRKSKSQKPIVKTRRYYLMQIMLNTFSKASLKVS